MRPLFFFGILSACHWLQVHIASSLPNVPATTHGSSCGPGRDFLLSYGLYEDPLVEGLYQTLSLLKTIYQRLTTE